ncbi:ABC transporter permease [Chelatococcus sambhunathii]|uniref:ABC transporter permease n=1 Tax=Chelatococcus sambhunathii TaxID=363953 RepID=A0ABU1DGL0_9HYPH|nr:ABC transporter permease [Chelatococcus sambhunathii]MDR4307247.1 ABC transporter permease [Chelatococcus sambhunathii]
MRAANVLHLGVKELRGLARDPMMLILIVYAFTLSVYSQSRAIPETLNRAPIAIVDEDRSPVSARIASAFYPPFFTAPRLIDAAEMDRLMDQGEIAFALDIPADFQRDLLAGRAPTIQLNVDATRMSQGLSGAGYVQAIVSGEVTAFADRYRAVATPPADLVIRARFNPGLDKTWFGAVMNVINNVAMLSIILAGAALIREREHGTIEHLLVMPVSAGDIMVAKIWSMSLVVLAATAFSIYAIVEGALGVPIYGSVSLFLFGAALQLFATTSLGVFLATLAGSMPQFGMLLMLVLLPLQILSGGATPRESMPEAIRTLMLAAPNTHFVMLAQSVLYRGAGLSVIWPQLLALAGIGAAFFAFSLARFRRSLR